MTAIFIRRPVMTTLVMVGILFFGISCVSAAAGQRSADRRLPDDHGEREPSRRQSGDDGRRPSRRRSRNSSRRSPASTT